MPAKKAAAKKAAAKKQPTTTPDETPAAAPPAATEAAPQRPKERIVFPKALYEERKDDIKAPLKTHDLKWQFLGQGKGRYHAEGVNVFVMFTDDGVDYSVWGTDQATVDALLAAWRGILGTQGFAQAEALGAQAAEAEAAARESEAVRFWKLQEPQRRAGEPDFFFNKRMDEWRAKRPTE